MERVTRIELALSAWELACHARTDHEFAGQRRSGHCPLLTALPRRLPVDRARSGHGIDLPLRRSFRIPWSSAAILLGAGFLVVWLPPDVRRFRLVLARGWHGASAGLPLLPPPPGRKCVEAEADDGDNNTKIYSVTNAITETVIGNGSGTRKVNQCQYQIYQGGDSEA
jgi:hypothetical protein